ncbi:LysR family transcriptional regulator [Gilvimarinus agarilyticus]|uniref:LysR family transcriptional regulator n=1 Tax=Gilvimarinus agarilyticus TaxID=679259 RepID=UPI000695E297|nr:LysR family transcriptional regulator [Gilvimarinus agarilyticus]
MLNPQWLRTFAVVADTGNFTRSAERLGLTQAAVSQHVAQLEQQLGPVLIRRPRNMELTPAGHALLVYCAEFEQADHRLQQRLSRGERHKGDISLITPGSSGLFLYPLLLDLQQKHPELAIKHRFAPNPDIIQQVLDNRFEMGLVSIKPDDSRLTATQFTEEPLELVIPASADISGVKDLRTLGFIDHPDGLNMATRLLSRAYPGAGTINELPVRGFINQVGLILEPVARGLGFTVIPRYARKAFANSRAIKVVPLEHKVMDVLWLIHRAEWPLSARAQFALDYLTQRIRPTENASTEPARGANT